MTLSPTNQTKHAATPTNQAKANALIGAGAPFFGWLFWFTTPTGTENIRITNQSKN
jgi:hypothetical protein